MRRSGWRSDPALPGLVLFGAMVVAGFAAVTVGWRVVARTLVVPYQVPAIVSGGLGGLLLVGVGCGLSTIHLRRRLAAAERRQFARAIDELATVVSLSKARTRRP